MMNQADNRAAKLFADRVNHPAHHHVGQFIDQQQVESPSRQLDQRAKEPAGVEVEEGATVCQRNDLDLVPLCTQVFDETAVITCAT